MIAEQTQSDTLIESIALQELKAFLNKLFQFESQDLDFGIYKILHYKRHEIKQFVNELLVNRVRELLQTLSDTQAAEAQKELNELSQTSAISRWLEAKAKNDQNRIDIYEEDYKADIRKYRDLEALMQSAQVANDAELQIYNHLTLFFSRYYDKGDFVSKRRFGRNEKYVVPYNGEETHFYWANHDQYYIKSAEHFQHFAFKVPHPAGTLVVNFRLADVQTEQGNVKADDTNYFVLADCEPELTGDILTLFFEYRSLTEAEKKTLGSQNKQDKLNEQAAQTLEGKLTREYITVGMWTKEDDQSLLLKKLHQYTRSNKYDFFIHKDLRGFFRRELDFYIKSELINVDDLYVLDTDLHFDRIRHSFKTIKVFKVLADTIIDLLGQIETFQKQLWEKKKFVLRTDWIITVDKLVGWLGEQPATTLLNDVVTNAAQLAEWKTLFGDDVLTDWNGLTVAGLKWPKSAKKQGEIFTEEPADVWRKFPIDTAHFSADFKDALLNALSERINLEEVADGLVLHSDNYHGLMALQEKFQQQIKCIYIDPPYNTSASEIIYKNSFKHSSWNSMIEPRVAAGKLLLKLNGLHCATIDDFEYQNFKQILDSKFGNSYLSTVCIRINPSGRPTPTGFAVSHEYAIFHAASEDVSVGRFGRSDELNKRYKGEDKDGIYMWELLRKRGSNSERRDRPTLYFPLFVGPNGIRVPKIEWEDSPKTWFLKEEPQADETVVYPVDESGMERNWRWSAENITGRPSAIKAEKNAKGVYTIYYKYRPPKGISSTTTWIDSKYSATEHGTAIVKNLFGDYNPFSYPKSIYAVKDCLHLANGEDDALFLDYFGGSGTTFHATQLLNREDEGSRKCILIEQGSYVYTVILPRIKKIGYTFDWKDGRSKDNSMNGLGVFVKYQRLEQYEESLENIAFTAPAEATQLALGFKDYIPKYFLEFETRDSQTLVNTAAMLNPWAYELKVWDGFTYDNRQAVDLVETFNYLIGLHVHKSLVKLVNSPGGTPRRYQFVYGQTNAGKQILIVWRDVTGWQESDYVADKAVLTEELSAFAYDVLYLNHQALWESYQTIEDVFKTNMIL